MKQTLYDYVNIPRTENIMSNIYFITMYTSIKAYKPCHLMVFN